LGIKWGFREETGMQPGGEERGIALEFLVHGDAEDEAFGACYNEHYFGGNARQKVGLVRLL
jgi:hypothetical protein